MSEEKKVVTLRMSEEVYSALEELSAFYGASTINATAIKVFTEHKKLVAKSHNLESALNVRTKKLEQLISLVQQREVLEKLILEQVE